jgi:hypothetical protein
MESPNPSLSNNSLSNDDVLSEHLAELRQIEKEGYELGVKRARQIFYWIAGLVLASELALAYIRDLLSAAIVIAAVVEAVLFLGIGLLTYKKPYVAIISGLVLLIGLRLVGVIYGSGNILTGIVVMVIFVILLIRALPDARKWERMEKEN